MNLNGYNGMTLDDWQNQPEIVREIVADEFFRRSIQTGLESTIAIGTGMILGGALTIGAIHSPEYVIPATALAGLAGTITYGFCNDAVGDIGVGDIALATFAGGILCGFAGGSIGLLLGDGMLPDAAMVINTAIGGAFCGVFFGGG
ncbi:MAG: hypothetical protein IIA87_05640, partial [Nanoarchaeota archaeon]|nr:hypothetical protein [Nanoarchaeota archaeon]